MDTRDDDAPGAERLLPPAVVVAAVIVDAGAVLAQQRGHPPETAGRWEFPGGRVEQGESEPEALVREVREELGIGVAVLARLQTELRLPGPLVLRAYRAVLVEGTPRALEHRDVRWIPDAELEACDWLTSDRRLLPEVRAGLG